MTDELHFEESFCSDLSSLRDGAFEVSIDLLVNNGIPILSYLTSIYKSMSGISRQFELKKIYRYLFQLQGTSLEQRVKFLSQISENKKLCSSFSEMTLSVISKVDDIIKSDIIGFITRQMILSNIGHDIGIRSIKIIEKINYQDLMYLIDNDISVWNKNQIIVDSIFSLGILTSWQIMVPSSDGFPINYRINVFGEEFKKILDDYSFDSKRNA